MIDAANGAETSSRTEAPRDRVALDGYQSDGLERRRRRSVAGSEGWSRPHPPASVRSARLRTLGASSTAALRSLPPFGKGGIVALAAIAFLALVIGGGVILHASHGAKTAAAFLAAGTQAEAAGYWSECVSDYSQAIARAPSSAAAFAGRGRCEYAGGDLESSTNDLSRAIALVGKDVTPSLWFARANAYDALGNESGAVSDYRSVIGDPLATPSDVASAVEGLRIDNDVPESLASAAAALRRFPFAWQVYDQLAISQAAFGESTSAAGQFATALQLATTSADRAQVLFDRSQFRQADGDLADALADATGAIALDAQWEEYRLRAGIRQTLGDFAGAESDLTQAIAVDARTYPDDSSAQLQLHDRRGKLRLLMGLKNAAAADFSAALALASDPATRDVLQGELNSAR